ncbi:hypothetical protein GCM10011344_46080 [Dokdonia pacifica]|uniref:Uncharacterized protein n=1 Tax=Dokdonia pacifica TaxID=1627892 RepID=A0A239DD87_9FLAO|nr:hypothetical protein [Dokdonia pacifica]GGG40002.1 hypothetical protein GCM10011344_46080 [Dokdonia pacifica]SNS29881.1 hypothetical protein SAMN06265376_11094 [Dokdonia pacifica]
MRKILFTIVLGVLCTPLFANTSLTDGFNIGNPEIGSINAMTFGPESILFIGDSQGAQVVAIDLSTAPTATNEKLNIPDVELLLSELLGADSDQLQIVDMVVNPANQNIYIGAQHSSGKSFLFLVNNNSLEMVPLQSVSYSNTAVSNAIATEAKDRRGRPLRKWAISDIKYANGQVMVSGLSNAEFASTFRSIPFPFTQKQEESSLEIYHAAHGQYETASPIKAFTTTQINNEPHLIASYTCTPLVVFPLSELKSGAHTKGRTVAELGNWNTPLDIIEMEKEGARYILMANTNRALMKIKVADIESFGNSLTTRVAERADTAGVDFINLPFVNVQQLDKLNATEFVFIQREASGKLALKTSSNRWL